MRGYWDRLLIVTGKRRNEMGVEMMYSYDNVMEMIPQYHEFFCSTSFYFLVVGESDSWGRS